MYRNNHAIAVFFFLLSLHACRGQTSAYGTADSTAVKLDQYVVQNLQEKAYISTDKPYYALGDTIWFQSYLVNAINHLPMTRSNVLYVELLDHTGTVLSKVTLLSQSGVAPGEFAIGEKWIPGKYMIRAYTKWMMNFPEEYLYRKTFDIFNVWPKHDEGLEPIATNDTYTVLQESGKTKESSPPTIQVDFLPEGGNLVAGIPTILGIKSYLRQGGKSVKVTGVLLDRVSGDTLTGFETNEHGLGYVILIKPANPLSMTLTSPLGPYASDLPEVTNNAYNLRVSNHFRAQSLHVMVSTDRDEGINGGFVIGHTRGRVFAILRMEGPNVLKQKLMAVQKASIPDGVAHFTFFDARGRPQCERLVFVDQKSTLLQPTINTDKNTYGKRELVTLRIDLMDTLDAIASLAVTQNQAIVRNPDNETLYSYLLLSSDIDDQITTPNYYLHHDTKESHMQRNLLMLTHGWRRFDWQNILNPDSTLLPHTPEAGITIEGTIKNFTFRNKPVAGLIELVTLSPEMSFDQQETDARGHFRFDQMYYQDTVKYIVQAKKDNKAKQYKYFIDLAQWDRPIFTGYDESVSISEEQETVFVAQSNREYVIDKSYGEQTIVLDAITIEQAKENPYNKVSSSVYASPDYRVITDSLMTQPAMLLDVLRQIPFIQITSSGQASIRRQVPELYVDGFLLEPPLDQDVIMGTPASDVYFVDIDKTGLSTSRGVPVIYVYTKSGNGIPHASDKRTTPGIVHLEYPGFYKAATFYAPKYASNEPKVAKPDYRLLVYWQPIVEIRKGKAEVSFYVGDESSDYDITLEGITSNGKILETKETLTVE